MSRLLRSIFIGWIVVRHGLDQLVLDSLPHPWLKRLSLLLRLGRRFSEPRGVRLRLALEQLGPIFVKFGQVLSTRRDLLPPDIAEELALLQDRVPPFATEVAVATGERPFRPPVDAVSPSFDRPAEPIASSAPSPFPFTK